MFFYFTKILSRSSEWCKMHNIGNLQQCTVCIRIKTDKIHVSFELTFNFGCFIGA